MTAACRLSRWTETYLDGELSPEHTIDFEDHLSGCCCCRAKLRFEQALRFSMQRTTRVATHSSTEFEAKLRARIAAERQTAQPRPQATEVPAPARPYPRPLTWRAIAPLSVAAAAALVFAAMRNEPGDFGAKALRADTTGSSVTAKDTMQTVQEFLDQLAAETEHNADGSTELVEESEPVFAPPRAPAVINVNGSRRWPLPKLESVGGIWEGLRYRNLAVQGRVPSLHYRIGGHRVLLWAYDSERVPLRVLLEPRVALNHPVFVGTHHGLAVAAVERHGHGFVATTDLSPSEAAELVVTAAVH